MRPRVRDASVRRLTDMLSRLKEERVAVERKYRDAEASVKEAQATVSDAARHVQRLQV